MRRVVLAEWRIAKPVAGFQNWFMVQCTKMR
jgi:hypothetical protein